MNQEQQAPMQTNVPVQPQPPVYTPEQIKQIKITNKRKLVWGLVCLIVPTALFIVTILLYAIFNFVSAGVAVSTANAMPFTNSNPGHQIVNIFLFIGGVISFLTWLPGIITGIILLTSRKNV